MQDRITEAVVGILEPTLRRAEIDRARRRPPESMDAYDHYLRGLADQEVFDRDTIERGLRHSLKAAALDPGYGPALALAAQCHLIKWFQGWMEDEEAETAAGLDLVERALAADPLDPFILAVAGHCYAVFGGDLRKGITLLDEAIALNPNDAWAYLRSGIVRCFADDISIALVHLERAQRLCPRERKYTLLAGLSLAQQISGDVEAAYANALKSVQANAHYVPGWRSLASTAAQLGREAEAREAAAKLLEINPKFTIAAFAARFPFSRPERIAPALDGLRKAGLLE